MERETGIEPATSSLGSCSLPLGQRRIKELQRAERARMGHCRRQLNTILNTKPRALFFPLVRRATLVCHSVSNREHAFE
jgi:hypothetical protein